MPQFSVTGSGKLDLTAQDFTGFDGIIWNTNGNLIVELNNERFKNTPGNLPTASLFTGHLAFVDVLQINMAAGATFAASSFSFTQWTDGVDYTIFYDMGSTAENMTGTNFDDRFRVTGGNGDVVNGLLGGTDTLIINYSGETDSFAMSGANTIITDFSNTSVSFSNIEKFDATFGTGNDNVVFGNGADTVDGGGGSDTLNTGKGSAIVIGGSGTDRWAADFTDVSAAISINLNLAGTQNIGNNSTLNGIEILTFTSGTGNDVITTSVANPDQALNDSVNGYDGDDIITVGGGFDTVDGGAGNDVLIIDYSTDDDAFSMSGANTTITDFSNTSVNFTNIERFDFRGGSNGDSIVLGAGNDSASGGGGDDTLNTAAGAATVDGGLGNDRWSADLSAFGTAFTIDLNTATKQDIGNDSFLTGIERLTLIGSTGNDIIGTLTNVSPDAGNNDSVNGGKGDDIITVGGGFDTVAGGEGNDVLVIDFSSDDDAFSMSGSNTTITDFANTSVNFANIERFDFRGGSNADSIVLGAGNDSASGGNGDDTLDTAAGAATVDGGIGNDRWSADLSAFSAGFNIDLNTATKQDIGNGSFLTSIERLSLTGGTGNDIIGTLTNFSPDFGNNDSVNGGNGDDTITAGGGSDSIDGGLGNDLLIIDYSTDDDAFSMSGSNTTITDFSNTSVNFSNIERFDFRGGSLSDSVIFGAGNDSASGGGGDDSLNTAAGAATVDGGIGNDRWSANLSAFTEAFNIDLNVATKQDIGNGSFLTSIERLSITAGAGNDVIRTLTTSPDANNNDNVSGGDGDDTITVGGGFDTVNGGQGNDLLIMDFSADDDSFNMAGANTSISDFSNTSVNFSNIERFDFRGGSANDNILLFAGDDILRGGLGTNALNGGGGNDTIDWRLATSAITLVLGASGNGSLSATGLGTDNFTDIESILAGTNNDVLTGNTFDNYLSGGLGNDSLSGSDGNDLLGGNAGDDSLEGGNGIDAADFSDATAAINFTVGATTFAAAGLGNDTLVSIEGAHGSAFNDVLTGDINDNILRGNGGNDSLTGNNGNDILDGGAGNDLVNSDAGNDFADGGEGNDTINGGAGNDVINGGAGNDSIDGGTQNDNISGGAGNDTLLGGAGNETIDGGTGRDRMTGGTGNDFYTVDDTGDVIIEGTTDGTADTVNTTLNTYTLPANVERVVFIGTGAFVGIGNSGANQFNGNIGDDRFVDVAGGNDTISAGNGSDSMDFRSSSTGAIINLSTGVHGGAAAGDSYSSIEKFFGSNTQADTMTGGTGRANFSGFGGDDTLIGGSNIDALQGNAGNDSLDGLGGVDSLDGGAGNDTLTGGAANDYFIYSAAGFGQDLITDFANGFDKLKVNSSIANNISAFNITGNGTTSVVLTQISSPTNTITLNAAAAITITAADFLFY